MASENVMVQSVKFYETATAIFTLDVVYNKEWKKHSLHLTRNYSYTKDGVTKQGENTIFLNLSCAASLLTRLGPALQLAKRLEEENGVKMYRLFTLIFIILF